MTATEGLQIEVANGVGHIRLDREKALNALSMAMYRGLLETLRAWRHDDAVKTVLIEGAGERAFCAGGDIRALFEARARDDAAFLAEIFRLEYTMNHLIHVYPKPFVALMDGITMGGGCGVSVHGSHRVVTERTKLAMPETGIGFFPDIGASWFLGRCPGEVGPYLGLTGARIGAADALHAGLADVFVPAERVAELASRLAAGMDPDAALARFAGDPGPSALAGQRAAIDRCFGFASVQEIAAAAAAEDLWSDDLCPFSQMVALQAVRAGAAMEIAEVMVMEYRICRRILERDDLYEGIRAAVIDKDRNPRWSPAYLSEVDPAEVAGCFKPLGSEDLVVD